MANKNTGVNVRKGNEAYQSELERRVFVKRLGSVAAGMVLSPQLVQGASNQQKKTIHEDLRKKYSAEALQIVQRTTCIDMLGTFGDSFHKRGGMPLELLWQRVPASFQNADYEFVRSAGIDIFGWGSMVPDFDGMLEFMALQNGIIASNPGFFERIDTREKLAKLEGTGKIGMLITNQESSHFRTMDDVDLFYGLGQRVSQITYNRENKLGCGAFDPADKGLTRYGRDIIERMNRVGMGVDVSHCGDKTTLDAISVSSKPVLITHGACRGVAKGVARAKTDEAIKAVARTGGVIGIPILRFMIKNKEPVSLSDFLDHIDYVAQLVGIEYVGIGSDQGLYTEDSAPLEYRKYRLENAPPQYQCHTNEDFLITIEKLNHPFRTYDIADGLLRRGYSAAHISMVLGENFKRTLTAIFNH